MEKNKNIINKIEKCFNLYNSCLINKDFLIVYKLKDKFNILNLQFKKENFLHLTGIEKIKPLKFYEKLNDKTLKTEDIKVGQYSNIKLSVFPEMINIFKEKSEIGTYDENNKFHKNLSIDQGLTLSIPKSDVILGIRKIENGKSVPVSLLKQKLKKISKKDTITDIICMFEKNVIEEQYNKIIYNTVDVKNLLQENKELEKLLTEDLLKEIFPKEENLEENKGIEVVDKNEIIQPSSLKKENTKETIIVENKEINEKKTKIIEKVKPEKEKPKRQTRSRAKSKENER